ncbi:unnamed protein product, partial [Ectocarpus sp. 8 AP-2014]
MRGPGGAGEGNDAAAAAAAAGANTLAPSAFTEAESLLECLAELMPTLEEAFGLADELSECSSTQDFDRSRQALLVPGVRNNDRFAEVFSRLEALATRVMKLSRRLRSRNKKKKKRNAAAAAAAASNPAGSAADEEAGVTAAAAAAAGDDDSSDDDDDDG